MKRVLLIILAVVAVVAILGLSFAGLSSRNSQNRSPDSFGVPAIGFGGGGGAPATEVPAALEPPAPDMAYDATGNAVKSEESSSAVGQAAQQEHMIIQTVDMAVVVKDPQARMSEIGKMAQDMGG